jgi:hypothetical protein
MFERYTEEARRALFYSRYEASQFGSRTISTEHLLLGVLREGKGGVCGRCVAAFHVSVDDIRKEVERVTERGEKVSTSVEIPFTAEMKRVLQYAADEADRLMDKSIRPEHLLLGLLREEGCMAASILASRGMTLEAARDYVRTHPVLPTEAAAPLVSDEQQLRDIEADLARAWLHKDRAYIENVLAPVWSVTQPDGQMLTRATVLGPFFDGVHLDSNVVDDVRVLLFGTTAVVRGRTVASGTLNGRPVSARIRFTDVFVKRAGRWQAVASHASQLLE